LKTNERWREQIWLNMNEVTNFCNGRCYAQDDSIYDYLPYSPTGNPLRDKTISMDIQMYDGSIQFNAHSINNGFLEVIATHKYLATKTDLPFILTRQNSAGTGRYAAHWTGDNVSSFKFMSLSISGILSSALFGIPFTGADICGFGGNTTEDLCSRWAQLGAWYPFSRNHNHIDSISQEFYALGATVEETARVSFKLRYSLLKHIYSKFVKRAGVGMVYQPIFFADPEDTQLLDNAWVGSSFLIDNETLIYPNLNEDSQNLLAIFPKGTWFFLNGTVASASTISNQILVDAPLNVSAPTFVRAGSIISLQNVTGVTRTNQLDNQFSLTAYISTTNMAASGYLLGISNYTNDTMVKQAFENQCITEFNIGLSKFNSAYIGNFTIETKVSGCSVDFGIGSLTLHVANGYGSSTFTLPGKIDVTPDTISRSFICDSLALKCSLNE
jgi:alpha-glucosidase (family GH31 glycosyl hydrolase)